MSANGVGMRKVQNHPAWSDGAESAGLAVTFPEIYDRYGRSLYNYVCWQLGNVHDADDVFASICEKIFAKLHGYDPRRAPVSCWVFAIARNAVIDAMRERRRNRDVALSAVAEPASMSPTAEEALIRNEDGKRLTRLVSTLGRREREIIALKFSAGMTNQAISRFLRFREGHVAVILHRAIHHLRERLEEEQP